MEQNYPNPFNPSTEICYHLSERGDVHLSISNLLGQEIKTLVNDNQPAGSHTIRWDGTNQSGQPMPSGIYLYNLRAGNLKEIRKMSLIR